MNYILKPGTYDIKYVGKKQPGLDLSRAIGDFLVAKGLATTEDCCVYTLVGGGAAGPTTVSTSFDVLNNQLTTTVNGVASVATISTDTTDVKLASPLTVSGTTYAIGTSLSVVLSAIATSVHPAASFTNTAAPFSWNSATQVGNIPQSPTLVDNGNGTVTWTPGTGGAPVVIDIKENATETVTTAAITVGATTFPIGTSVQVVLAALATTPSTTHSPITALAGNNPALFVDTITQEVKLDLDIAGSYDNATSGLTATSIQDAIDELAAVPPVTADNGLTKTVDNIQLGGPLIKNTNIGGAEFNLTITDVGTFQVTTDGAFGGGTTSSLTVTGGSQPFASSVVNPNFESSIIQDIFGVASLNSEDIGSGLNSKIAVMGDEAEMASGTKTVTVNNTQHRLDNLNAGVQANVVYYNPGTFEITHAPAPVGLPAVTSMYNSDALAAAGGIAINQAYWADSAHVEGAVHGTLKLRTV